MSTTPGVTAEIPLGRLGETDDFARVVSFLAAPDGGWVSGKIIKANGGRNGVAWRRAHP